MEEGLLQLNALCAHVHAADCCKLLLVLSIVCGIGFEPKGNRIAAVVQKCTALCRLALWSAVLCGAMPCYAAF